MGRHDNVNHHCNEMEQSEKHFLRLRLNIKMQISKFQFGHDKIFSVFNCGRKCIAM